jgi:hypothetical protein
MRELFLKSCWISWRALLAIDDLLSSIYSHHDPIRGRVSYKYREYSFAIRNFKVAIRKLRMP